MLITIHPYRDLVITEYDYNTIIGDIISEIKFNTYEGIKSFLIKETVIFYNPINRTYWLNAKDRFIFKN